MTAMDHINEWKRFAEAYLRWSHFNMDRIVNDAVKRDHAIPTKRRGDAS